MTDPEAIRNALNLIPGATYILTASYEETRGGVIVHWVQRCADEPPLISVSVCKGHALEPLIRDSRAFGISRVDPDDKLIHRKFRADRPPDDLGDPFDAVGAVTLETGSPILKRAIAAFDCEVVRHYDIEADNELYVGRVLAVRMPKSAPSST